MNRIKSEDIYNRGQSYYRDGKVEEVRSTKDRDYFLAYVRGQRLYQVKIEFRFNGDIHKSSCNCPYFQENDGDCKHIVALLLAIENLGSKKARKTVNKQSEGSIENIFDKYRNLVDLKKNPINLEINFTKILGDQAEYGGSRVDLRMGQDTLYVVRNMNDILYKISNEETIEFGQKFTYKPNIHMFKPEDQEIIEFLSLLRENVDNKTNASYGNWLRSFFKGKYVYLNSKSLNKFFQLMIGRKFNIQIGDQEFEDSTIVEEGLGLDIGLSKDGKDLIMDLRSDEIVVPLTDNKEYIFYKDKIHKIPRGEALAILPILSEIKDKDIKAIRIKEEHRQVFVSDLLTNIKKNSNFIVDEEVEEAIYDKELEATLYFDRKDDVILGKLEFAYGEVSINPFSPKEKIQLEGEQILLRDTEEEEKIMFLLEEGDFKVEKGGFYLEEEEEIFDFISQVIPELQKHCQVYYSESFKNIGLIDSSGFSGALRINHDLNMLEFSFSIDDIDTSELESIFSSVEEKKKYYKLKNGAFLALDNKELTDVVDLLTYLKMDGSDLKDGHLIIPKFKTMYLDKFVEDKEMDFVQKNIDFKKLVRDIKKPDEIHYELPKGLNIDLRDYQKFGFKWLKSLAKYGFGGILADEMGLGKTAQMIAFLLSEKEEKGHEANLVIVPTSLVYNWEEEIHRFAPSLSTIVIAGTKEERNQLIETIGDYDLAITSYPLIRRDIEEHINVDYRYCILDEAQHIKNQGSLSAKSSKRIRAKNYFALTGTPMENTLSELWSIFDFIMPGYLSTNKDFVDRYERPIVRDEDSKKLKDLNNHIKPFILRRLKKDVLKELPDKIEQKILVDMNKEQRELYLAYLQAIKGEINDLVTIEGYGKSHMKILAGLTRLRQICCHPGVFVEDYQGGSGKLDSLEEIVNEALSGGHRILVFSQFTTMLAKIRDMLEDNGVDVFYLDGSTPMRERGRLVRNFNKGQGQVFLISLKAGGTGINLTSADMVIHFDPWWNPAVEDQATDRAHRIGQENTVQVIKLITKGTIEEKIFKLQEKKKKMIDKVIREGETLISKLSEEEIMSLFDQ